tara:strand:- start:73 stop:690 length:618 start_codon:yes stop_codon:yes gene_type:complete
MKKYVILLLLSFILPNTEIEKNKVIIKENPDFIFKPKEDIYKTTNYKSRLLSSPNSNSEILKIPADTKLKILEKKSVQQGRMVNNWYKVKYKRKIGWVSGWNMKEGEELIISSIEDMNKAYAEEIGAKPENNPLTGKIKVIVKWLKKNAHNPKSIEYIQWYKPYYSDGYWCCRLEFSGSNSLGGIVKEDKIFKIKNNKIVEVVDK